MANSILYAFIRKGSLEPYEIDILRKGFAEALRLARLTDQRGVEVEMLARCAVKAFERGEIVPHWIAM